ncbi:MAG: S-adenosylmethionine:tRNA ribosyltransferase-isomerase, partial [Candidatus Omnitrophota bacterium]
MEIDVYNLSNFNYDIPQALVAQEPFEPRDECRLLVLNRKSCSIEEGIFKNITGFIDREDVLVINDTKVFNARLAGRRETGAKVEILLTKELEPGLWEALAKPGKRARIGEQLFFDCGLSALISSR